MERAFFPSPINLSPRTSDDFHLPPISVTLDKQPYDARPFLEKHPGGLQAILAHDGQDITGIIDAHSNPAYVRKKFEKFLKLPKLPPEKSLPSQSAASFFALSDNALDDACMLTVYDPVAKRVRFANGKPARLDIKGHDPIAIHEAFREKIGGKTFPCIAGKTALNQGSYVIGIYPEPLGSPNNSAALVADLRAFMLFQDRQWGQKNVFNTFIAIFPTLSGELGTEKTYDTFQNNLTKRSEIQRQLVGIQNADRQSTDGMSTLKRKFLIPALHPLSDRLSREFQYPTLVFNSKDQFQMLEESNVLPGLQVFIRKQDKKISGSEANQPLRTLSISVPNQIVQEEVDALQKVLAQGEWSDKDSLMSHIFKKLNTYLRFMPSIAGALTDIAKETTWLNGYGKEEMFELIESHWPSLTGNERINLYKAVRGVKEDKNSFTEEQREKLSKWETELTKAIDS